jgi:O-antigen/teichoic acid export membrane protein/aminoglycoside phosphotransferase (APT) family kinase protein
MSGAVASGHAVGRRSARRRLVEHVRTPLVRDGYALAFNSAFTAAVGLVYWIVAAHAFSARAIGLNAALISAMMFVAGVSTLNLSNIFVRFLPGAGRKVRRFVLVSYAAATLVAALGASLLMLFADGTPTWMRVWFVVASVAWCLFVLQDAVLTALGRAVWVPVENAGFSLLKLGLLPLLALVAPLYGLFVSWTAGMVLMVVAVNAVIFGRLLRPDRQLLHGPGVLPRPREFARYFAADWVCALAWLASTTLLPVIVLAVAGATTNAYFSLAWAVAFPLYAIGHNIGTSLVLHGASDRPALPQLVRKAALQGGALLLACVVVLVAVAPYALSLFGGDYADGATTLLRLLALAALPNLVLSLAVSVARVERRLRVAMIALGAQALLSLGSAALLVEAIGVSGAGVAWLGSQCIVATGVLMLPLRRELRVHRPSAILADVASGGWLRAAHGARGARLVLGDTARSVRRIRTDSDLVVFRAATRGAPEVVVKLAWTPVGADRVAAHLAAVRSLRSLPRLGAWTSLLPDVLDVGAVRGRPYVVERALPGVDARPFASDGRRDAAVAAAARSMRPLYDATSTDVLVDSAWLEAWVHQRLDRVGRERAGAGREAFAGPRSAFEAALLGQHVRAGSVHGDLWLGNVLMDPDTCSVSGIVDWEHASSVGPVAADLAHLVLSTRSLTCREPLGAVAARLIEGRDSLSATERELLTGWGMSAREALLLAWLQHLTGRLAQSTLHTHGRWMRRNADPVLEALRA